MNKFAERLKYLRTEKNWAQKDLAEKCGVIKRTVSHWECGARECDFDMLLTLSDIFDCSIDFLLGKTDF